MQLKRQSVEAWQNKKHYSKVNNTSENTISRREIFISFDHVITKVSSGHNIVVCAVFSLSFQAVVLLTKTAINHRVFFNLV